MNIEKRIELLKEKITGSDFLLGRGLGNEIPFWIFDYPPEHELLVRRSVEVLKRNLMIHSINVLEIDLYRICLEILEDKISFEKLNDFEAKKGSDQLLKKLRIILKPDTIKKAIQKQIDSNGNVNVVFLTGIGKAWPLVRSHSVLNNLQPIMGNIPLVVYYPGEYDNYELSLFGKFKDANYYRAFRLIADNAI